MTKAQTLTIWLLLIASVSAQIPQLASNPTAPAKLYLDFDGDFQAQWGAKTNITQAAFDKSGNPAILTAAELTMIRDIHARVAEDFAPFNLDVTTIDPGALVKKVSGKVVIGGSSSWYAAGAGGVSYIGGFYNHRPNVAFVFEDNLSSAKSLADCTSHEAGHLFGMNHQSRYHPYTTTLKTQEYNTGSTAIAPLMGNSYRATRSIWWRGPISASSTLIEDNIAILAGPLNGYGLRDDDFPTVSPLPDGPVSGLIGHHTDQDAWEFTTEGGPVSFTLKGIGAATNLDAVLEIKGVAVAAPTDSLNASLALDLPAGTYTVIARSDGAYGNMGQYTLESAR